MTSSSLQWNGLMIITILFSSTSKSWTSVVVNPKDIFILGLPLKSPFHCAEDFSWTGGIPSPPSLFALTGVVFRHVCVSSTYPVPMSDVRRLVTHTSFHSISVSGCSMWKVEESEPQLFFNFRSRYKFFLNFLSSSSTFSVLLLLQLSQFFSNFLSFSSTFSVLKM